MSNRESASFRYRTALLALRQALSSELILADRERVALNPDVPLQVDVREFERAAQATPQAAPEWYCGELLTDFAGEWILPLRARYRELYLATLLTVIQELRSASQYDRAAEQARRLLATDAANERAHQHLMFCLAALGERVAALAQYEICKRTLRETLGIEPSHETRQLYESLQRQGAPPRLSRQTCPSP